MNNMEVTPRFWNKKTECLSKHWHDSQAESVYCNFLQAELEAHRIEGFKVQVPFDIARGILHVVDFLVSTSTLTVHEVKGLETPLWKLKHRVFLKKYPDIEYRIIKR